MGLVSRQVSWEGLPLGVLSLGWFTFLSWASISCMALWHSIPFNSIPWQPSRGSLFSISVKVMALDSVYWKVPLLSFLRKGGGRGVENFSREGWELQTFFWLAAFRWHWKRCTGKVDAARWKSKILRGVPHNFLVFSRLLRTCLKVCCREFYSPEFSKD